MELGGVIKIFARGVIKKFSGWGWRGVNKNVFIADFGLLGQKLVPAAAGEIFFPSRFFFLKKKRRQLKKLKIWGRGSKAISEGVGVVLKARGVKFFFRGG